MTATMQILRPSLRAAPAFALLLLSVPLQTPASSWRDHAAPGSQAEKEARLEKVVGSIDRAFVRCDAGSLEQALPRRVKVYVSARSFGIEEAYYGADQTVLLFRRLCDGRTTLRFVPAGPPARTQADGEASLTALWISRDETGTEADLRIVFALGPDGSGIAIREIRELK